MRPLRRDADDLGETRLALTIREIIASMRPHTDGGGQPGWVELVTSIDGVANGQVRRIVLREG
jgi:hypothetical protein